MGLWFFGNAEKVRVTGNKMKGKMYHRYTGYIGNLKSISQNPSRPQPYSGSARNRITII